MSLMTFFWSDALYCIASQSYCYQDCAIYSWSQYKFYHARTYIHLGNKLDWSRCLHTNWHADTRDVVGVCWLWRTNDMDRCDCDVEVKISILCRVADMYTTSNILGYLVVWSIISSSNWFALCKYWQQEYHLHCSVPCVKRLISHLVVFVNSLAYAFAALHLYTWRFYEGIFKA